MKGIIPKYFINELLHQTDIVNIIHNRIPLKKIGKNYNAHCPFHQENTPSFTVSYEKQFYYCFGCNSHGNVIDFLINYDKLTFIESIEELAYINGFKIPYDKKHFYQKFNYEKRNNLYILTRKLSHYYHKNLFHVKYAYKYLINRGINKNTIKHFNIGFSNINWNDIENKIETNKLNFQEFIDIGVFIVNEKGKKYDRLKGRIIFPIYNKNGEVVGFGGRSINNTIPKYINSPDTEIFKKGRTIYGLFEILKNNPKPKKLLIVEGYFDVITLFQFSINYSIALLGTSITNYQIQLLFRITNNIIFCYDGDFAGKEAAWRTLKISLPYIHDGKYIKFVFLPGGEDPDTIIRKEGCKNFEKRIKNATHLSKFLFDKLLKNINLESIRERSYLSSIVMPLINKIPGKIMRIYLLQELGNKIGIPDHNVLMKFNVIETQKILKKHDKFKSLTQMTMRTLISLLIQKPKLALCVPPIKNSNNFQLKGLSIFLDLVKKCIEFPNCNTGQILEMYRNTKIFDKLNQFAKWNHMIIENQITKVFLDSLINLKNKILEYEYNMLISKDRNIGLQKNEKNKLWIISKQLKQ
ncbi:MAG: DNA primase [Buchnera aphidicola (Nurudea ibofushi)]